MEFESIVKHPDFGTGKILTWKYDTNNKPLILVQWNNKQHNHYFVESLEHSNNQTILWVVEC